jgi:hypothetical protein
MSKNSDDDKNELLSKKIIIKKPGKTMLNIPRKTDSLIFKIFIFAEKIKRRLIINIDIPITG